MELWNQAINGPWVGSPRDQKVQASKKSSPAIVVCSFHVELGVGAEDVEVLVEVDVDVDVELELELKLELEIVLEVELEVEVEVVVVPREVDPRVDERVEAVDVEPREVVWVEEVELPPGAGLPVGCLIQRLARWPGVRRWNERRG